MLPLILLSYIALSVAAPGCDPDNIAITGGEYCLSNGTNIGSRVKYTCPKGKYPHPHSTRECKFNGHWSYEKEKAECRAFQCPRPVMFDNGMVNPQKNKYLVGDVLVYPCMEDFQGVGPAFRTCQANGKWSGEERKCDDLDGDCPNPGIPIGATKVGSIYKIGARVKYECEPGLQLYGSKERECMEDGHWSGAEPSCRSWYAYDTPKEVAEDLSASLSERIESSDPSIEGDIARTITVRGESFMNIFILIDASKGVGEKNFQTTKEAGAVFIEKMASFDFTPRYAVISYASSAKPVVQISDNYSTDAMAVIEKINTIQYTDHGDNQGKNIRAALAEVHKMLTVQNSEDPKKFLEMRNVILLMTYGKHNMGGDPIVELKKIRKIVDIRKDNDREDYLDVYVFGVGYDVDFTEINNFASKKHHEKHFFKMKCENDLKRVFEEMLNGTETSQTCGLSRPPSPGVEGVEETYPWIAKITITRLDQEEKCKGSIVSKSYILTAAHCFRLEDEPLHITVRVGGKSYRVKNLHRHDKYNPLAKRDKKVEKSFDYDVALIELGEKIQFSRKVRPICLPCTTGASWALKQRGKSVTCRDHEKTLLSLHLAKAMFIAEEKHKDLQRMNVIIKQGNKRQACLEDTKMIEEYRHIANIKDLVTDNFFCTGGVEPVVDSQTCKADAGGPLIVPFKQRYIQVGVISWGTINSCTGPRRNPDPVPALSRDFHINLFHMIDWLKEKLGEELEFLK